MFKISVFGLSSVFYTSCTKKEPYLFIGKTHKFKNCLNLMTLDMILRLSSTMDVETMASILNMSVDELEKYIKKKEGAVTNK